MMTAIGGDLWSGTCGSSFSRGMPLLRQSALQQEYRLSEYIISKDISVPIILKIRIWSRRLSVWWYPEDIRILLWLRIMESMRSLAEHRDDAAGEAFDKVARAIGLRLSGGTED